MGELYKPDPLCCVPEGPHIFILPMLGLLSSKAQAFLKSFKSPCVDIHWIARTEYAQMSTHVPGFQEFLRFFASFYIDQISHQQHKGE